MLGEGVDLFALLMMQQPGKRAEFTDQELMEGADRIVLTRTYNAYRMVTVITAKRTPPPRLLEIRPTTRAAEPGQRSSGKVRRMTPADYAELPAARGFDYGITRRDLAGCSRLRAAYEGD